MRTRCLVDPAHFGSDPGQSHGALADLLQAAALGHAALTRVALKALGAAVFLHQQHVVGIFSAFVFGAIHAGAAHRHTGYRQTQRSGPLFQQALDVGRRHMAFDDVAAHRGGVARTQ
mgnify:CR=1 FL=1